MEEPEVEEAVEVQVNGTMEARGLMTLWKDLSLTMCFKKETTLGTSDVITEASCFDLESVPANRQIFQMLKDIYTNMGFEVIPLFREKEKAAEEIRRI